MLVGIILQEYILKITWRCNWSQFFRVELSSSLEYSNFNLQFYNVLNNPPGSKILVNVGFIVVVSFVLRFGIGSFP